MTVSLSREGSRMPTRPFVLLGAAAVSLALAACSSSSGGSTGASSPSGSSSAANGARRGPAASGRIAAITGTTMQVQNQQSGQVAVSWTAKTAFSHQVTASASAVAVGSCVMATGGSGGASSTASFTATRVVLTPATDGACGGGFGGGGGQRPSGFPSGIRPSDRAFPSAAPGGTQRGAVAFGKVTAKSGASLTVSMQVPGSSAPATTRTVTIAGTTKVYTQAATTATSLAVGKCVSAQGAADSSGTVTATRVQITEAVNGVCTTGFGAR